MQRVDELTATARRRVPGADAGFVAFERELTYGGGLIAGGLAYRLFLWLLPIGLVGAQSLGIWFDVNDDSVEDAAKDLGIGAAAIASAAKAVEASQTNRVLLLLTGLVLLAWFSLGFVRALLLAYSLAWGLPRPKLRKPVYAVIFFNGLFLMVAVAGAGLTWLREALGLLGILGVLVTIAFETGVAVLVMWLLPRRAERWQELVPGALLVSVGTQLVSVAVVFYFAPRIGRYSELYGALGTAAVLLVWLYVLARLITSGAFLNATLWERRYGGSTDEVSGRAK
ncbi:MAG: YhjD/YihY/BrkB family envelope integrity protein [Thermoleophilaceae bacterium]